MDTPEHHKITDHDIDEELKNTFPASDAPSWTLGLEPDHALMKAVRVHAYGGPEQLTLDNVPVYPVHEEEVLVRVKAASVNPIDYKLASGALRPVMNNEAVVLPWIPGGDFAGVVESVGKKVKEIRKGDEVYGNAPSGGAYAQCVVARVAASKPRRLSFMEAASVPLAGQTAWQALFRHGHLHSGQTVLIHGGAGGVGSFAVQLARWESARVITTGARDHLDFLESLGAHEVVDYQATAFETAVKGVDLVIDLIGGDTQERSFKVLRPGGTLVSTVNPPSEELAMKHKVNAMMMTMRPSIQQLHQLAELLDSGEIKTHVTKVYPLIEAPQAWEDILSHHTMGKIVLEIK